jgi:hypothetical protein
VPFKGELVTWASGHENARKAAHDKACELFRKHAGSNDLEFLTLLTELMHASFAYGAITADLSAGRFR